MCLRRNFLRCKFGKILKSFSLNNSQGIPNKAPLLLHEKKKDSIVYDGIYIWYFSEISQ